MDIDTDVDTQADPWFSREERVELSGFDPAIVARNINNYETIKEWWPDSTVLKPGMLAGGGAPKQMRLVGRLALFRKFNDQSKGPSLINKLEAATDALFTIENKKQTESKSDDSVSYTVEDGCRVYLVFSPCGGTGSSMSFDIAYLCRHLLSGKSPTIISVNIMPRVIDKLLKKETQAQRDKIRANAYAWFKEDQYLSQNPYWRVEYPGEVLVEQDAPPFDFRFIIDIENQAGHRLDSADDVFNMVAQSIFMDTGSSISGDMRGFTQNVTVLGDSFENSMRIYSSLASATLLYPKDRLLDYCASKLSVALIKQGLMGEPNINEVEASASAILSQLKLRDAELINSLMVQVRARMAQEPAIKKAESVAAALSLIDAQKAQNQTALRVEKEKMNKRAEDKLERIKREFDQEFTKLACLKGFNFSLKVMDTFLEESPAGVVDQNVNSLNGLISRITQLGASEDDLVSENSSFKQDKEALKKMDDGVEDVLERKISPKGWKKKFVLYKTECLNDMRNNNDLEMQINAQQQGISIYDQLVAHTSEMKARISKILNATSIIADDFKSHMEFLLENPETQAHTFEFMQEIEVDYQSYYNQNIESIDPVSIFSAMIPAQAQENISTLETWVSRDLYDTVKEYAAGFFYNNLQKISLLDAIKNAAEKDNKEPETLVGEYLDDMLKYCHPFWQWDQNRGLHDLEGHSTLGVEFENSPYIPENYKNAELYALKSTLRPDRIDVLRVWHGLPAFLIHGMNEYKQKYDKRIKAKDPLHILPEMEFAPDLMPEKDAQNREIFARGLAFDYIVPIGTFYYYDPDRLHKSNKISPTREYRLAQGREKAEDAFSRNEDWSKEVEDLIEAEVRQMGNEAAIEKLEDAIDKHLEIIRKTGSEVTLRRQYEKEIRALKDYQRQLGKVW